MLAEDVKSGKEVTVEWLTLTHKYSYTEEDVSNLLTILPVARIVCIWLSYVPLTSSNLSYWATLDGQWEWIQFINGQIQPDWMSDLGKIFSRATAAHMSNVKMQSCDFAEFSKAFILGLESGGNCERVTFRKSTKDKWGEDLKKLSKQIKWKVTQDDESIEINRQK